MQEEDKIIDDKETHEYQEMEKREKEEANQTSYDYDKNVHGSETAEYLKKIDEAPDINPCEVSSEMCNFVQDAKEKAKKILQRMLMKGYVKCQVTFTPDEVENIIKKYKEFGVNIQSHEDIEYYMKNSYLNSLNIIKESFDE